MTLENKNVTQALIIDRYAMFGFLQSTAGVVQLTNTNIKRALRSTYTQKSMEKSLFYNANKGRLLDFFLHNVEFISRRVGERRRRRV